MQGILGQGVDKLMQHLATPQGQLALGMLGRPNQRIGQAISGAMGDLGRAQTAQQAAMLQKMQMDEMRNQMQQQQQQRQLMQEKYPELAGLPQHIQQAIMKQKAAEAAANQPLTLSPGAVYFDPRTQKAIYQAPTKEDAGSFMHFDPETGQFYYGTGKAGAAGASMFGKKGQGKVDSDIISAMDGLARVERVGNMYKEQFLTLEGDVKQAIGKGISYLGGDVNPDLKQFVQQRTAFRNEVDQMFNSYRKEITGAAASVTELERLKKTMMNTDMSPIEFEAAYGQFVGLARRQLTLAMQLQSQGLTRQEITRQLNADYRLMKDKEMDEMERAVLGVSGAAPAAPGPQAGSLQQRAAEVLRQRQMQRGGSF